MTSMEKLKLDYVNLCIELASISSKTSLKHLKDITAQFKAVKSDDETSIQLCSLCINLKKDYITRLMLSSGVKYQGIEFINDLDAVHSKIVNDTNITDKTRNSLLRFLDRAWSQRDSYKASIEVGNPNIAAGAYTWIGIILNILKKARRVQRNKDRFLAFVNSCATVEDPENFVKEVEIFKTIEQGCNDGQLFENVDLSNMQQNKRRNYGFYGFIDPSIYTAKLHDKFLGIIAIENLEKMGFSLKTFELMFPLGISHSIHLQYRSKVLSNRAITHEAFLRFCRETESLIERDNPQRAYADLIRLKETAERYFDFGKKETA